jgi:hypothetical protein
MLILEESDSQGQFDWESYWQAAMLSRGAELLNPRLSRVLTVRDRLEVAGINGELLMVAKQAAEVFANDERMLPLLPAIKSAIDKAETLLSDN